MRHVFRVPLLAILGLLLLAVPTLAQEQTVNTINGIGLVDYSRKPDFKVGDWVKYRMTSSSFMGMTDDYTVTVLVAGEEEFWGERCFWIETWTEIAGRPPDAVATLMSYAIFRDSLAIPRMQMYMRKSINGIDALGRPAQTILKRAAQSLKSRNLAPRPAQWDVDTLAADTVVTPKGTFTGRRVSIRQGTGVEQVVGDSTFYNEQRENRMLYLADGVPITHLSREDVESLVSRRSYMIGRSKEAAPLRLREQANGVARLVDFGGGLEAKLVPAAFRRSLAEQQRGPSPGARPRSTARRASR